MKRYRNWEKVEIQDINYLDERIVAWKETWEEYDDEKDKWQKKSQVYCHVHFRQRDTINLRECNDGSKFTAVNQAINNAKYFIEFCQKKVK